MKLVHLVPTDGESAFYELLLAIERAAAGKLGVELEVLHVGGSREKLVAAGAELGRRTPRPDCVLLPNFQGAAHELLPALDAAGVDAFLVVEGLTPSDRMACGEPRTKLARWVGELVPDEVGAGQQLAELLVNEARARGLPAADGKVHVGVLAGTQTFAGQGRFQGWRALQRSRPEVVQAIVQYGNWARDVARSVTAIMLRGHPEIAAIWAANDAMALGALEAASECGRRPGKDLLVGGMDLLAEALAAVDDGRMAVSLGGHVLDGARAVVLLHDRSQGRDFAPVARQSLLEPVSRKAAASYRRFFEARGWEKVDFGRFSSARSAPEELTLAGLL